MFNLKSDMDYRLRGFGSELLQGIRDKNEEILQNVRLEERRKNILTAATAMIEAKVSKEMIIASLQNHWDLRLSEATFVFQSAQKSLD